MAAELRCRILVVIATSGALAAGAVLAASPLERRADCLCDDAQFSGFTPTFQSGDAVPKDGVFSIALQPVANIVYLVGQKDKATTGHGGVVTIEYLPPGRYTIVLNQDAELDAVQHRPFSPIPVVRTKTESGCFMREVAYEGGPLTLQLSGVDALSIMLSVTRLPD